MQCIFDSEFNFITTVVVIVRDLNAYFLPIFNTLFLALSIIAILTWVR